jgi:hypothetical protein
VGLSNFCAKPCFLSSFRIGRSAARWLRPRWSRLTAGARVAGVGHQVTILDNGVLYRGECYRSLSEVARLITGARWSGPRFFGLNE